MDNSKSSISISNPLEKENEIWAICPIYESEDTENQIILTSKNLVITTNSNTYSFPVNIINSLETGRKKYLLPIIIGGIASPLSILGLQENIYSSTFLIVLLFTSVFLIYYGVMGAPVIIVKTRGTEEFIFLKEIKNQLKEFIWFSNSLIPQIGKKDGKFILYALVLEKEARLLTKEEDEYKVKENAFLTDIQLFTEINIRKYIRDNPNNDVSQYKVLSIEHGKLSNPITIKLLDNGSFGLFAKDISTNSIIGISKPGNFQ